MTRLATQAAATLPDADRAASQTIDDRQERAAMEPVLLDAAIEFNRRNTPREVTDKRRHPRYSIAELNAMDIDRIRERFESLPKLDTRPASVRFLDLIDAPRNLVGNALARTVLPGAAREADERGDTGAGGLTRITGADLLRGVGIDNRVALGLGGLAIDLVTDPFSWIGGPLGGTAVRGASGARVSLSTTGQKVLNRSLRQAAKGGIESVTDDAARALFEATVKSRGITETGKELRSRLSKELIGDTGGAARNALNPVIGQAGRGGLLADDAFRVASAAGSDADRVRAVGDFVGRYTTNRGVNLGKNPTVALAHVPFTDITLNVPAYAHFGKEARLQRAVALAQEGRVTEGQAFAQVQGAIDEIDDLTDRLAAQTELRQRAVDLGDDLGREAAETRLGELRAALSGDESPINRIRQARSLIFDRAQEAFNTPESIGDALAVAEGLREADAKLRSVVTKAGLHDTLKDIEAARTIGVAADRLGVEAVFRAANNGALPEDFDLPTVFDDVAPAARQTEEYLRVRDAALARHGEIGTRLGALAQDDLDAAENLARAMNERISAAAEVSALSRVPLMRTLEREERDLVRAASMVMGMDPRTTGFMPLGSFSELARHYDSDRAAEVIDALGAGVARGFGVNKGRFDETRAAILNAMQSGANNEAARVANSFLRGGDGFSKGLRQIIRDHGVDSENVDALLSLVAASYLARHAPDAPDYWGNFAGRASAAARHIEEARRAGWLTQSPELMADVEKLADEFGGVFEQLGKRAQDQGLLNLTIDGYLPNTPTQYGRDLLGTQGDNLTSAGVTPAARGGGRIREAFQKPRSTWEIRFADADGQERSFLLLDRSVYGNLDEADFQRMARTAGPAAADKAREIQANVKAFDELYGGLDDITVSRQFGRPLDPFELNERFANGELAFLTGKPTGSEAVFSTNPVDMLLSRVASQHSAEARKAFGEAVMPHAKTLPLDPGTAAQLASKGETAYLRDGTAVKMLGAKGKTRFMVGDTAYRMVDTEALRAIGADPFGLLEQIGNANQSVFLPEAVAEGFERFMRQTTDPTRLSGVFKFANDFNRLWRATTLAHPSWSVVNTIGNTFLLAMAHPDVFFSPKGVYDTMRTAVRLTANRHNEQALRNIAVEVGGQTINGLDFLRLADQNRISQGGLSADALMHVMDEAASGPVREAANIPSRMKRSFQRNLDLATLARAGKGGASPNVADRVKAMAMTASENWRRPVHAWFKFNGAIDDAFRLTAFMKYLDQGNDAAEAAVRTRRSMLSFGDLTELESKRLRPLLPFYTWLRASLPAMTSKLATDPRYFTIIQRLTDASEELFAGEDRLPRHQRPRWMQQQLAIQISQDPETRKALLIGTVLPQEQAIRTVSGVLGIVGAPSGIVPFGGQDLMDFADFWLSQTGPLVKGGVELASGRELFSGRTIGTDITEGDITLSEYLLGQFRPLRELGVGSVRAGALQRAFDDGPGTFTARLAVGGRLQPGLQEDRRLFALRRDLREDEQKIRKAIRLAEREGDEEAMLSAQTKLMQTYDRHIRSGGDAGDIPKWAREQLAQLSVDAGTP